MQRSSSFLAVVVLPSLLFSVPAQARDENRTWDREFQVARRPTVRVETDDARVTVRSWRDSRVKIHVEKRGRTEGLVLGRRHPLVEMSQQGNDIRVLARMEGSTSGIVFSSTQLEVEVWLPRESDLIAETADGSVNVEQVSGRIELETEDGPITGRGLRGEVRVRSSDGQVQLDEIDGTLEIQSQDGSCKVSGRFDRIDAEIEDGGLGVDALPGSRMRTGWSLRSEDGGIRLRIPRGLVATIDAHTEGGRLSVGLPLRAQGKVRRHEVVGDLNGGGEILRLRCDDGAIRVSAID
jgi:hypothetical protein